MGQHTSVTSLLGKNTGDFSRKQVQRKLNLLTMSLGKLREQRESSWELNKL